MITKLFQVNRLTSRKATFISLKHMTSGRQLLRRKEGSREVPSLFYTYKGAKRTDMFYFLRDKIERRISGWAHRHLSFGGRLTLIKSTLEAIPIHLFQAIEPTNAALHILEQQLARFFWGATREKKKTHWIGWDQICRQTSEGGLGIRRFEEVLRAFGIKLWWRFREQSSL